MTNHRARDSAAAVGLLESTHYLRNQLLRDSDWASMGHSLELRTPLVDAQLLSTLGPYVGGFKRGAGKVMLAQRARKTVARNGRETSEDWLQPAYGEMAIRSDGKAPLGRLALAGHSRNTVGAALGANSH